MKKLYTILAAIVAVIGIVSCDKEPVVDHSTDLKLNIKVAGLDGSSDTRAVKTSWADGDKLNIWYDSNVTAKPDLVIEYDGSEWKVDGSETVSGAAPSPSGSLKVLYISGHTVTSCFSSSDLSGVFGYPFMLYTVKNVMGEKVDNINRAYTVPLISYAFGEYTYTGNTLTASIDDWTFEKINNCHVVITNLPEGRWALRCDLLMPRHSIALGESTFSAANDSPNTYVFPVDNEDGKAFIFYTFNTGTDYVFELYNIDTTIKYSFTATDKSLDRTGKKLNAIAIDFSKFTAM